jgi:hypothetical protein
MVIPFLVVFVALAYLILRTETIMADFSKLTSAVTALTVEVDVAIAKLHSSVEDPAVQAGIESAAAAVQAQTDKLAAAAPPTPTP